MTDREIILESKVAELEQQNAELMETLEDIKYIKCPMCGCSSVHYSGGNWEWACNQCGNIYNSRTGKWGNSKLRDRIAELERRNAELVEALRKIENFASRYIGNEATIKIRRMSSAAIRAGENV